MPIHATFNTSEGTFKARLYDDKAPKTVANFVELAEGTREWTDPRTKEKLKAPLYDGTIFHRIIPGFMVQGGGMDENMKTKAGQRAPIKNEAENGLKNKRGTLAMARTNDINSATSQFFINLVDNDFLDHKPGNYGYAVFGRIESGLDVVDAIAAVKTGRKSGHENVPTESVVIESARRIT